MTTVQPLHPTVPPPKAVSLPREPTPNERLKIRGLLDLHFDDAVGNYLGGQSDAMIAEAVAVPRAIVERMREAAYGPIRANPEVVALQAEIAAVSCDIEAMKNALTKLDHKIQDLHSRAGKLSA